MTLTIKSAPSAAFSSTPRPTKLPSICEYKSFSWPLGEERAVFVQIRRACAAVYSSMVAAGFMAKCNCAIWAAFQTALRASFK